MKEDTFWRNYFYRVSQIFQLADLGQLEPVSPPESPDASFREDEDGHSSPTQELLFDQDDFLENHDAGSMISSVTANFFKKLNSENNNTDDIELSPIQSTTKETPKETPNASSLLSSNKKSHPNSPLIPIVQTGIRQEPTASNPSNTTATIPSLPSSSRKNNHMHEPSHSDDHPILATTSANSSPLLSSNKYTNESRHSDRGDSKDDEEKDKAVEEEEIFKKIMDENATSLDVLALGKSSSATAAGKQDDTVQDATVAMEDEDPNNNAWEEDLNELYELLGDATSSSELKQN